MAEKDRITRTASGNQNKYTNATAAKAVHEFEAVLLGFFSADGEKAGPSADGDKKEGADKVRSSHILHACHHVCICTNAQAIIDFCYCDRQRKKSLKRQKKAICPLRWLVRALLSLTGQVTGCCFGCNVVFCPAGGAKASPDGNLSDDEGEGGKEKDKEKKMKKKKKKEKVIRLCYHAPMQHVPESYIKTHIDIMKQTFLCFATGCWLFFRQR